MSLLIKMRSISLLVIFSLIMLLPLFAKDDADKKENNDSKLVIKSVSGHNFEVPEDRPIEVKNSIIAPMPVDEYIAVKFSKIESRLQKIEESTGQIKDQLNTIQAQLSSPKVKKSP